MTKQIKRLGTLKKVGLRDIWTHEALGFTPWLAEPDNLALLGEALGLKLIFHAQEERVGPFRADIICKDTAGHLVLIENQLGPSDHSHLGQIIMYAAGLDIRTVVSNSPRVLRRTPESVRLAERTRP